MVFDRALTNSKRMSHLLVRRARDDQIKHLSFAWCQGGDERGRLLTQRGALD